MSIEPGKSGRHYKGKGVEGFGNELWIIVDGVKREKSISRSRLKHVSTMKIGVVLRGLGEKVKYENGYDGKRYSINYYR